jgi:hypothetical protein
MEGDSLRAPKINNVYYGDISFLNSLINAGEDTIIFCFQNVIAGTLNLNTATTDIDYLHLIGYGGAQFDRVIISLIDKPDVFILEGIEFGGDISDTIMITATSTQGYFAIKGCRFTKCYTLIRNQDSGGINPVPHDRFIMLIQDNIFDSVYTKYPWTIDYTRTVIYVDMGQPAVVERNRFHYVYNAGGDAYCIMADDGRNLTVRENYIYDCDNGIRMWHAGKLENNYVYAQKVGVRIAQGIYTMNNNSVIAESLALYCELSGTSGALILNNYFASRYIGAKIKGGDERVDFISNVITAFDEPSIDTTLKIGLLSEGVNLTIEGGRIYDADVGLKLVSDSSEYNITNLRITECDTGIILPESSYYYFHIDKSKIEGVNYAIFTPAISQNASGYGEVFITNSEFKNQITAITLGDVNAVIENCWIMGFSNTGINFQAYSPTTTDSLTHFVKNSYIKGASASIGIASYKYALLFINDSKFEGVIYGIFCGTYAIESFIKDCVFRNLTTGIYVSAFQDAERTYIEGNLFDNVTTPINSSISIHKRDNYHIGTGYLTEN